MGRSAAAAPTSILAPGTRLDRYELLAPLAEGGMASVWIARQRGKHGFEKLVALKTILPEYAADLRFQQLFLDEARIASKIEHFNVARILDLGEEHDILYLAMEYVDGDALSKLRRSWEKRGLPPPTGIILRVLADACSGLHEAHDMKGDDGRPLEIVHRDVSPHNILVSLKGVTKVIDFGIAKARDRLADETNAGALKGKIQYMAPEQALGRRVDRRSDVWAVGATLYSLLAGRAAYQSESTLGTLQMLTSGQPPEPLPTSIHPSVANIARKALSTAPERRFASAAEMRDAIEAAMLDARIATTSSGVAAFALEHLAERTAKRRQLVDIALAAAAERERVEGILMPALDRTGSGIASSPRIPTVPPASRGVSGAHSIPPPAEALPPWPPPTLTDTPPPVEAVPPRSRAPLVVGFFVGGAAVAAVLAVAALRGRSGASDGARAASSPVSSAAAATSTTSTTSATLAISATSATSTGALAAAPPPSSAPDPTPELPVVAADSLPKAESTSASFAAGHPTHASSVAAPPGRLAPAATTTTTTRHRHPRPVDDGF